MKKTDLTKAAKILSSAGSSKGGKARAKKLSSARRSEIARKAAKKRWSIPKATHSGELEISKAVSISCYVLEDGTRLLSLSGVQTGMGMSRGGPKQRGAHRLGQFLAKFKSKGLSDSDLSARLDRPVVFLPPHGGRTAFGFEATVLTDLAEFVLQCRDHDLLTPTQQHIAVRCEMILRALARVGIIALVDEATGYQEIRDRRALQKILEKYLTDEWAKWTKTFPDEFYRELFRLKSLPYPPSDKSRKPSYVGHWTNNIVYSRLAPGVKRTLQEKNPRRPSGSRSRKHHQHLTRDYGHPELTRHLSNVVFLMKTCREWDEFINRLNKAAPKYGDTIPLDF